MSEELYSELARRLVIGRKRDGRSIYDPQVKAELVAVCQSSGVSVARIARECGVNANQLASWIRRNGRAQEESAAPAKVSFVPMSLPAPRGEPAPPSCVELKARLPNGVVLELRGCELDRATALIELLGGLRCSASTRG